MQISTSLPHTLVYSLFEHEYLGYLLNSYIVQLNSRNGLTLLNQVVSTQNMTEFEAELDEIDFELIPLIEAMQQDYVLKRFNTKKLSALEFFTKTYDSQKGDKALQESIAEHIDSIKAKVFSRLYNKRIYIMGTDNNPAWKKVQLMPQPIKSYFHFIRNESETHYFPILKHNNERLQIRYKNAFMLADKPAWLLIADKLYHFDKHVDGKKIRPFLQKNHIVIPKNVEYQYYQRFVAPLIAGYEVFAKGFQIEYVTAEPTAIVQFSAQNTMPTDEGSLSFTMWFSYGSYQFKWENFDQYAFVTFEKQQDDYLFYKFKRDFKTERKYLEILHQLGLNFTNHKSFIVFQNGFDWLQANQTQLEERGIKLQQDKDNQTKYFLGYATIDITFKEEQDWFDVYSKVRFGDFEIPFIKLKDYILSRKKEFLLPNGEVAIIPSSWFAKYAELFAFAEYEENQEKLFLKKHHISLVQDLGEESLAATIVSRKLQALHSFSSIDASPLPHNFVGTLRPYQKAGYDWLNFLNQYKLGGCLADDMGLGKTVTTLAMLQYQKEQGAQYPSLLVMPTSLLYNWEKEAQKFTPTLKTLIYSGANREKSIAELNQYDLIFTSYGIARIDIELLKKIKFNYIILDESQAIKNPASYTTQAVYQLQSNHRLILTGTPLENTTLDLWSQMSFVNPGLLGNQSYFRNQFQIPIEKHHDKDKSQRLYNLIKPFMLRRHKSQVATDLPPKVESIYYSQMTEEQEQRYEEVKSYYRNYILQQIDEKGMAKSQIILLEGLSKLRQMANHPRLVEPDYEASSGKLNDIQELLETIISENHKVLIFSQFVKHLTIVRQYLDTQAIVYTYLDGATTHRQQVVDKFQQEADIQVFLISLKAGGVGLNLTAADYVFILDPWWNPAVEAQAIDRAYRIGQQKTVFTYKFITKNSIEEKILDLQNSKQQLFNNLITTEESFVKSLTKDDIASLLA